METRVLGEFLAKNPVELRKFQFVQELDGVSHFICRISKPLGVQGCNEESDTNDVVT